MTYLEFLILFLLIPLSFLVYFFYTSNLPNKRDFLFGTTALAIIAFVYTTPWDNYLVMNNVWSYGIDRVQGVIGYVPIEEYCFFILQTYFTGLFCYRMQSFASVLKKKDDNIYKKRYLVTFLYVLIFVMGVSSLFFETSFYLGLILVWSMPIIIFQWFVGSRYLVANKKLLFISTSIPTVYLWVADTIAINLNIWQINSKYILGISLAGLPFEEATFFMVTNLMLTQGLILFVAMKDDLLKIYKNRKRSIFK